MEAVSAAAKSLMTFSLCSKRSESVVVYCEYGDAEICRNTKYWPAAYQAKKGSNMSGWQRAESKS